MDYPTRNKNIHETTTATFFISNFFFFIYKTSINVFMIFFQERKKTKINKFYHQYRFTNIVFREIPFSFAVPLPYSAENINSKLQIHPSEE